MNILIVGPVPANRGRGNRITAARWTRILSRLGHEVRFGPEYDGRSCDLLVALHAIASAPSIASFRDAHPHRPAVVALTGTDIYGLGTLFDEEGLAAARRSMAAASALIAFHPLAADQVPAELRSKVRVIPQSIEPPDTNIEPRADVFEVCVAGELRDVKDPFRTALAARRVRSDSRLKVLQAGAAGSPAMAARATEEARSNPRYEWLGELSHGATLDLIARSRLLVVSSRHEGGPNVITEALAARTPVLASRIPGTIGILGEPYAGYFDVEDTDALARLLERAESDGEFYDVLGRDCRARAALASPAAEVEAWKELLASL